MGVAGALFAIAAAAIVAVWGWLGSMVQMPPSPLASEAELYGRPVPPKRIELIRELRGEMVKQQSFQVNRMNELSTLNSEFDRMLARFREVRGAAAAAKPASAPETPPPAPATPAGSR